MNTAEGVRRIAVAIRFVGTMIAAAVWWTLYKDQAWQWYVAWMLGGIFLVFFWGLAWIIDGFAKPKA